ncbi:hypothetical protein [Clostridium arbusti]|uniref:hypothetical protein n=1 Tax=Clostridium arbusti TaxID=1137848 RepID=UPI0011111E2B|nr:hypothetical protein [Clostridium arbusti]
MELLIYDTNLSLALKSEIGQYEIKKIVLFGINNSDTKFENLYIKYTGNREIKFKVKCPICHKYHYYTYKLEDFFKKTILIGGCEVLGDPIFFVGKTKQINERINKYMKIKNKVCAMI